MRASILREGGGVDGDGHAARVQLLGTDPPAAAIRLIGDEGGPSDRDAQRAAVEGGRSESCAAVRGLIGLQRAIRQRDGGGAGAGGGYVYRGAIGGVPIPSEVRVV